MEARSVHTRGRDLNVKTVVEARSAHTRGKDPSAPYLNYNLQVFLKECKYMKRDAIFESQLSDDDEGYDTVN